MAEQIEHDPTLPPPAETIHLPGPSFLPPLMALGLLVLLVGLLLSWVISALGALLVVVVLVRWIGSARQEMAELPLEHGSH